MIDKITLDRIGTIHPKDRDSANEMYHKQCAALPDDIMLRYPYTLRTFAEQHNLFLQGRDGKGGSIVTNADQGLSYHNYGLAYDIVLIIDGKASWKVDEHWMKVVEIAKQFGYEWGGDWKKFPDKPHFQKTHGYSVQQLLDKFNKNDFIHNTNYVRI